MVSPCPYTAKMGERDGWIVQGEDLKHLFDWCQENSFALPAVNCISTSSIDAVLEAAAKTQNPIIVQLSQGGGQFIGGKSTAATTYNEVDYADSKFPATIAGSISLALHTRAVAPLYKVPVIIHSDHCAKGLIPWFDGMLKANEEYFAKEKKLTGTGKPLFSSHMLDLSTETDKENIRICVEKLERMKKIGLWLEMEIGITGGEEDGVCNEDADPRDLMTTPDQILAVYKAFSEVSPYFTIAASFGNVHGVYAPGNVKLDPTILKEHQAKVAEFIGKPGSKPLYLVFHGGSGSSAEDIKTAVENGVVKMNIDTDTQWAYWEGVLKFYHKNAFYLHSQIGNPEGVDKPNKKYFDPRTWLRKGEESMVERLAQAFEDLGAHSTLARTSAA